MKYLSLFLIASFLFSSCGENENNPQEGEQAPAQSKTLVEVVVVKEENVSENITANGDLMANEATQLSVEVGGKVNKITFEEGEEVKKGQLLLELTNADLAAELEEAKAQKELLEKQLNRNKKLFEAKGISEDLLQQTETKYDQQKATYQMLLANLNKTKVYAPFSGTIGLRSVSLGDYLSPMDAFANLVDLSSFKIQFSFPEKYTNALKIGDSIQFSTASNSTIKRAVIYAVEPQVNESSRTISAKAKYPNTDKQLSSGAFVEVSYQIESFDNSITIPNQAIVPELEGKKVFLVKNGKVISKRVTTGIRRADQIQVIEGLQKGDTIVTSGLLQIRDGIPVQTRMDNSFMTEKVNKSAPSKKEEK
jgi:membrane fusion protein (multidrug efflux system)